ncbi:MULTISPECIES: fatty acid desaturase [Burkholderia]|uniref:Fatty acid desaturase n=2 Tax=Burkholderia TaxID=32008 RepID=A0A318HY44_BURPY|nr:MULTISPECIES: fatty acid desaturase [Burkholderia]PXX21590.1 fatty acid desaturase [Burkholderia pyrrocinia]SFW90355.1 Fatty acid desaturase [Burkholderia sp. NFACC33-1]SFY46453.1 Fatty acid desaturase [Burkholderia sp. NFPP32]
MLTHDINAGFNMTKDEWLEMSSQLPRDTQGIRTVSLWFADLAILGAAWRLWIAAPLIAKPLAWMLAMVALIQLYLIMHEAIHTSVCRHRLLNDAIGHFCGWVIGLPFLPRRRSHLAHHAWTAHPIRDPENKGMIEKFSVMSEKEAGKLEFAWRHWIPMMAFNHFIRHWLLSFERKRNGPRSMQSKRERRFASLYLVGYLSVYLLAVMHHVALNLILFAAPLWIAMLIAIELLNLPHHAEIPLLPVDAQRPPLWEQDVVSHSCGSLPVWSTYIILNFNLHVAHHAFPWLSWHQLGRAQDLLAAHDRSTRQMNEWSFSLINRRRPLLHLMGHYFDKRHGADTTNVSNNSV